MNELGAFLEAYLAEIAGSILNNYTDNYDHLRFGEVSPTRHNYSLGSILRNLLRRRGYVGAKDLNDSSIAAFRLIAPYIDRFQRLYHNLADDESRELLVRILAYRALGPAKVKLPLSTPEYWQGIRRVERLADSGDYVQTSYMDWKLFRLHLRTLGVPLDCYASPQGAFGLFDLQQYRCLVADNVVQAEPDDYVIDAGACFGTTALYFAHKVGNQGKVLSCELVPSNLEILQKNLDLNPTLRDRITVVERALWSVSDLPIYYQDRGPATRVSLEPSSTSSDQTATLSVDDLVHRYNLPRVDFVKMDIEGAELSALKGAVETVKQFRPKLAISVYHRLQDFLEIPEFIASLGLGYHLHIRHFTIHNEETVLFAWAS